MSDLPNIFECADLDEAIEHHKTQFGYQLDMVVPADAPREAILSKNGERLRLKISSTLIKQPDAFNKNQEIWVKGRAGMEYRDLLPGRLGGRVIASHIRIPNGGQVADYVHYHKVEFQMIYCAKGSIKVVYEDQGEPFWLDTGDCVLQPPQIRHRVLECTAGAEVIEIGSPAEHETWVEHDIKLPTTRIDPLREFGGQRFVRHIASNATWQRCASNGCELRDTGISAATNGAYDVCVKRSIVDHCTCDINSVDLTKNLRFPLQTGEKLVVNLLSSNNAR